MTQIRFTGAGNLTDSVKTSFSLSGTLMVLPVSGSIEIPGPVSKAISSGNYQAQELYSDDLGQHRTITSADLSGSFAPVLQFQKREIHTVFPRFRNFELAQNLSLRFLAELCGVALVLLMEAWSNIRGRDPLVAEITVEADCGPISLQDGFSFYQWKLDDNLIWGAKKQDIPPGTTMNCAMR